MVKTGRLQKLRQGEKKKDTEDTATCWQWETDTKGTPV